MATANIETNAGMYSVTLKALVRDMPDYQSIVAEGDFTFTTDASHPFIVKDGAAYNSTAKVTDTAYNTASFTASFTVPEGKIGILSWDGDLDAMEPTEEGNWYTTDYGTVEISHPLNRFEERLRTQRRRRFRSDVRIRRVLGILLAVHTGKPLHQVHVHTERRLQV